VKSKPGPLGPDLYSRFSDETLKIASLLGKSLTAIRAESEIPGFIAYLEIEAMP